MNKNTTAEIPYSDSLVCTECGYINQTGRMDLDCPMCAMNAALLETLSWAEGHTFYGKPSYVKPAKKAVCLFEKVKKKIVNQMVMP